jgi:hypothetical protein
VGFHRELIGWRNELRLPTFPLLGTLGNARLTDQASPYAFDVRWGRRHGYGSTLGRSQRMIMGWLGRASASTIPSAATSWRRW